MLKWYGVLLLHLFFQLMGSKHIVAQSTQLLDGGGVFSNNSCWLSSNEGDFYLFSKPDITIGNDIIFFWDNSLNDYNNKNGDQTTGFIWYFKVVESILLNYYNIFMHKRVFILLC